MAILKYRTAFIDALLTVLEADAEFAAQFNALRTVKDNPQGWLKRAVLRSPADLPYLIADLGPGFAGSIFGQREGRAQSFAAERPGYHTGTWDETATAEITLTINYDKAKHDYARRDAVEMAIIQAIRSAGVGLGLSYCAGIDNYRASTRTGQLTFPGRAAFESIQTVLTLTARFELSGSEIV